MFEKAARLKIRFDSVVGGLSVEDLWEIPLSERLKNLSLDNIAKGLNRAIKEGDEESFVVKKSTEDTVLGLKFDIVKHIIKVRLEENEASEKAVETKAKKERIIAIIASKEDEELQGQSTDELKDLLNDL